MGEEYSYLENKTRTEMLLESTLGDGMCFPNELLACADTTVDAVNTCLPENFDWSNPDLSTITEEENIRECILAKTEKRQQCRDCMSEACQIACLLIPQCVAAQPVSGIICMLIGM